MFKALVGHSDQIGTVAAIEDVIAKCDQELGDDTPQAGLLFCASDHDCPRILEVINDQYPGLELIGCTTDGEMSDQRGFTEDAITLTLFCSDEVEIRAGLGRNASRDPVGSAHEAMAEARAELRQSPKLIIALPDGLTTSAHEVLDGLDKALETVVPIIGGMSADQVVSFKNSLETYQFFKTEVITDSVPILVFGGPLLHSLGVESGWSPLGEKMTITSAEGSVLKELDGRPPLDMYKHYLGHITQEDLSGLGAYPLAIFEEKSDLFYLRVPSKVDPETGFITFLGEIPDGTQARITQAIRDNIIQGARESVDKAVNLYPGSNPALAMLFSCTGRKLALGTKTREEILQVRNALSVGVPMCGFYTFGEIGPLSSKTRARYHNTTFVTLLMGIN